MMKDEPPSWRHFRPGVALRVPRRRSEPTDQRPPDTAIGSTHSDGGSDGETGSDHGENPRQVRFVEPEVLRHQRVDLGLHGEQARKAHGDGGTCRQTVTVEQSAELVTERRERHVEVDGQARSCCDEWLS